VKKRREINRNKKSLPILNIKKQKIITFKFCPQFLKEFSDF